MKNNGLIFDKTGGVSPSRLGLIFCFILAVSIVTVGVIEYFRSTDGFGASFSQSCFNVAIALMAVATGQRAINKVQERKIYEKEQDIEIQREAIGVSNEK